MRKTIAFSVSGLLLGAVFFAFSLTPSLIPRPTFVQGILSGVAFTIGYSCGVFFRWLWRYLQIPDIPLTLQQRQWLKRLVAAFGACLILGFLWQSTHWQNSVRVLMGMRAVSGGSPVTIGVVSLVVFLFFRSMGKGFHRVVLVVSARLQKSIPDRVAILAGLLVALALYWSLLSGVLLKLGLYTVSIFYEQLDQITAENLPPPQDPYKTGGSDSLLSWGSVGREGRRFMSLGPTAEDIWEIAGEGVDPIRVYVGLHSAETPQQRALLALEELKRVKAFEREILLIATPVGDGWIDPGAVNSLEFLYRGDVATVAVQYSYLPGPIALFTDAQAIRKSARALFEVIYDHWEGLPVGTRPRLYLYGLSLGAKLSEGSFEFFDVIDNPIDGALWAGPPFSMSAWRLITDNRDPGTPAWLPQFKGGEVVRFGNQYGGYLGQEPWGRFRIAFLQHASDPIVFFDFRWAYRRPEWLECPRGPDVSPDLRWFPVVTMLQLLADFYVGDTPQDFGHRYTPAGYTLAWVALTEPPDWSEAELQRLQAKLKTLSKR
ncbi:alpha/beta-hydrolase family protein [uncultured Microbulbifer sp.]|uniref:alpha/beta hydrolase n=1 Tax=uncultured Microbulbifer sp. TaxID=348147 RepID=UPI002607AE5A|nr:alpha/beta-hydrolase family protein [uncultured Microbulbifer sp.]